MWPAGLPRRLLISAGFRPGRKAINKHKPIRILQLCVVEERLSQSGFSDRVYTVLFDWPGWTLMSAASCLNSVLVNVFLHSSPAPPGYVASAGASRFQTSLPNAAACDAIFIDFPCFIHLSVRIQDVKWARASRKAANCFPAFYPTIWQIMKTQIFWRRLRSVRFGAARISASRHARPWCRASLFAAK